MRADELIATRQMKTCRTCNQTKPADAYRGTRSACRAIDAAMRKEGRGND